MAMMPQLNEKAAAPPFSFGIPQAPRRCSHLRAGAAHGGTGRPLPSLRAAAGSAALASPPAGPIAPFHDPLICAASMVSYRSNVAMACSCRWSRKIPVARA